MLADQNTKLMDKDNFKKQMNGIDKVNFKLLCSLNYLDKLIKLMYDYTFLFSTN